MLCAKGKVFSGKGEGSNFIKLPWVKEQIAEKLGFVPYPGTLNIKLAEESLALKNFLKKVNAIEISPATGFCCGRFFKAYLKGDVKCAVVIPEVANYPEDVIEIISSINLREKLQLKDGDAIEIKILL
jgi:riboflavin kinase